MFDQDKAAMRLLSEGDGAKETGREQAQGQGYIRVGIRVGFETEIKRARSNKPLSVHNRRRDFVGARARKRP